MPSAFAFHRSHGRADNCLHDLVGRLAFADIQVDDIVWTERHGVELLALSRPGRNGRLKKSHHQV